jgi:hypothetical protein
MWFCRSPGICADPFDETGVSIATMVPRREPRNDL